VVGHLGRDPHPPLVCLDGPSDKFHSLGVRQPRPFAACAGKKQTVAAEKGMVVDDPAE
jgi:hypothetical protein